MNGQIHKWEMQGVGKSPYKCVGLFSMPSRHLAEVNPDAYSKAMKAMPREYEIGTCRICGISLVNNYLIVAFCGKTFSVGCDCVQRVGDKGLIDEVKARKRAFERNIRFAAKESSRNAALEEQRKRNNGKTDWEVSEIAEKELRDKEQQLAHKKGARIAGILKPITDALSHELTPFKAAMIQELERGVIPTGRAFDLITSITADYSARHHIGSPRLKAYKEWKAQARREAEQMLNAAEHELEEYITN